MANVLSNVIFKILQTKIPDTTITTPNTILELPNISFKLKEIDLF